MADTDKVFIGSYVTPEKKGEFEGLARAAGLSRAEFLRRAITLAGSHLDEIREPVPEDPRRRWKH